MPLYVSFRRAFRGHTTIWYEPLEEENVGHEGCHEVTGDTYKHITIYPTEFSPPPSEFRATLLSCVGLVYCNAADKTKPYNELRGRLGGSEETNTLRFISEIRVGYCVKLNTNSKPIKEKTSYAVRG